MTKPDLLDVPVAPAAEADMRRLLDEIENAEAGDAPQRFEHALRDLDNLAGEALGLSRGMVRYCRMAMAFDPVLSKMRPSLLQRGLRVQAYRPEEAETDN